MQPEAAQLGAGLLRPQGRPPRFEDLESLLQGLLGGQLLAPAALDLAPDHQRAGKLEGHRQAGVLGQRLLGGLQRAVQVAACGTGQAPAAGCGRQRPGPVVLAARRLELVDQAQRPVQLAQGDEGFDLVGDEGGTERLPGAEPGNELDQGSEGLVDGGGIAQGQLEGSQGGEGEHREHEPSGALQACGCLLGLPPRLAHPPEVGVDQCHRGERGRGQPQRERQGPNFRR